MRADAARAVAADWLDGRFPDARGAVLTGSAAHLPDAADLPATSDVDVLVVVDAPPAKLGSVSHRGVCLDVDFLATAEATDADSVARTYYLAPSFAAGTILADPTGALTTVARRVAADFATPAAIGRRLDDVQHRVETRLRADRTGSWPEQVLAWLFPATLPTQLFLVAALRPPTVRRRFAAVREWAPAHAELLRLLGADATTAQRQLDALAPVTSDAAAVEGSQELIDAGQPEDAVFWIVATWARTQVALGTDTEAFRRAVAELLGLRTPADLTARTARILAALPGLRAQAEALIRE